MKKLLLIIIVFALNICALKAQDAVMAKTEDSRILKQIPADMVKNPVYLKGNLATWVNKANEFVVYAETSEKKYLYVLQMEKPRNIRPATGKFTSLTFIGDAMVLNDGKDNYYFGIVPVATNTVLESAHMVEKDFINIVQGYGLSRHSALADSKVYSLEKLKGATSVLKYLEQNRK